MYLNEGFCDYLSKPIDQVELDRILREQLKIGSNVKTANPEEPTEEPKPVAEPTPSEPVESSIIEPQNASVSNLESQNNTPQEIENTSTDIFNTNIEEPKPIDSSITKSLDISDQEDNNNDKIIP